MSGRTVRSLPATGSARERQRWPWLDIVAPLERQRAFRHVALCYNRLSGIGTRATQSRQPRQVRKEATVTGSCVCSGRPGAWRYDQNLGSESACTSPLLGERTERSVLNVAVARAQRSEALE